MSDIGELAMLLAWVDKSPQDVSKNPIELWQNLVDENKRRYRAMAARAIVWMEETR